MGEAKRYEAALDRARFLYRIPATPDNQRMLELFHAESPLLSECHGPGVSTSFCQIRTIRAVGPKGSASDAAPVAPSIVWNEPLPFAGQSFDTVVAHHALDDLAAAVVREGGKFDAELFFRNVVNVLVPGGLIAGCVDNRWSIKSWLHRLAKADQSTLQTPQAGYFTLRSLGRTLAKAGFSDIRLFTLLPDCSSPFKLIDADPTVSRSAFRHELQITRHVTLTPAYLLRRAVVELGLSRYLEHSIFFWAYKRC